MIHVTTPENSRIVKYSINNLGTLTTLSLTPRVDATKEKFTSGSGLSTTLVKKDHKGSDYQSMLASLIVESSDKSHSAVNIFYRNPPKAVQKPNKFEVESAKLLSFN